MYAIRSYYAPLSCEEHLQIGHPAMVDVGVGARQAPETFRRIAVEMRLHVLVHLLLQVDAKRTVGANDHIGAHPFVRRHIATGVITSYSIHYTKLYEAIRGGTRIQLPHTT